MSFDLFSDLIATFAPPMADEQDHVFVDELQHILPLIRVSSLSDANKERLLELLGVYSTVSTEQQCNDSGVRYVATDARRRFFFEPEYSSTPQSHALMHVPALRIRRTPALTASFLKFLVRVLHRGHLSLREAKNTAECEHVPQTYTLRLAYNALGSCQSCAIRILLEAAALDDFTDLDLINCLCHSALARLWDAQGTSLVLGVT